MSFLTPNQCTEGRISAITVESFVLAVVVIKKYAKKLQTSPHLDSCAADSHIDRQFGLMVTRLALINVVALHQTRLEPG